MSIIRVRISNRLIKLWLTQAINILKEENKEINFDNILNEIKQFDNTYIKVGLGKRDIEDIKNIYNGKMNDNNEI